MGDGSDDLASHHASTHSSRLLVEWLVAFGNLADCALPLGLVLQRPRDTTFLSICSYVPDSVMGVDSGHDYFRSLYSRTCTKVSTGRLLSADIVKRTPRIISSQYLAVCSAAFQNSRCPRREEQPRYPRKYCRVIVICGLTAVLISRRADNGC